MKNKMLGLLILTLISGNVFAKPLGGVRKGPLNEPVKDETGAGRSGGGAAAKLSPKQLELKLKLEVYRYSVTEGEIASLSDRVVESLLDLLKNNETAFKEAERASTEDVNIALNILGTLSAKEGTNPQMDQKNADSIAVISLVSANLLPPAARKAAGFTDADLSPLSRTILKTLRENPDISLSDLGREVFNSLKIQGKVKDDYAEWVRKIRECLRALGIIV